MVFGRYNTTYIIFSNSTVISFCTAIINYYRYIAKMMRSSTLNLFFTVDILVHSPLVQYYRNQFYMKRTIKMFNAVYNIFIFSM